eukprot:6212992-Pleurochrysis_carterae.AAC.4
MSYWDESDRHARDIPAQLPEARYRGRQRYEFTILQIKCLDLSAVTLKLATRLVTVACSCAVEHEDDNDSRQKRERHPRLHATLSPLFLPSQAAEHARRMLPPTPSRAPATVRARQESGAQKVEVGST